MSAPGPGTDPAVEALERVAYLLERQGAGGYKVQAFRRAAKSAAEAGPERLRSLAEAQRLEDLPGVGASTAAVIAEALAGAVPAYEQALLADEAPPLGTEAAGLLATLRGDCHSHSDWSDGGSPIEVMARTAAGLGREYLVLTDHSPRLTVANGLSAERLEQQLEVVASLNEVLAPFRLLSGIEVDILDDGALDQDESLLARLDVVVASVHSKLKMERAAMTRRMVAAVSNPHVDILGHCTGRLISGKGRPESQFDPAAVFSACAAAGTAVEINSRPERRDPPPPLLEAAVEAGCLFSIDTDAHAPGQLEWLRNGCEQAVAAGIGPERIVNTDPVESLLAWTRR